MSMTRLELRFSDEGICHCAVTWYYLGKIQLGTANEMILKTFWAVLVVVERSAFSHSFMTIRVQIQVQFLLWKIVWNEQKFKKKESRYDEQIKILEKYAYILKC